MPGFEKLRTMLDTAMKQASEESSMLLGQSLTVCASDMLNTDRKSYFGGEDNAIYVVGVESGDAYPGRFYLLFALADAIVMSSILLGIPAARIQEKRKLCIQETDDIDAFGEIANQIIGSFNSAFQPQLPEKVHLKLLPPQKYIPGVDLLNEDTPIPEGSYLMYRVPLEIAGQEMNRLDIMIQHPLANLFDPQPEADPESEVTGSPQDGVSEPLLAGTPTGLQEPLQAILILGDEDDRQRIAEALEPSGLNFIEAQLGADLPSLCSQGDVRVAVITMRHTGDRDLAICNRVVPLVSKGGGVVILCAPEWTRSSVLKALKAGVKGVLICPIDPHELNEKVRKALNVSLAPADFC